MKKKLKAILWRGLELGKVSEFLIKRYPLRYPLLLSRDKRLSVHSPLALSMYDSHGDSTSR